MTTLITGATGFVGSAVMRRLIEANHSVRVLTRAGADRRNLRDWPVETAIGDLTDRASLDRALKGCRYLFHVAADYRLWAPHPEEIYRNNVDGTRDIMRAAGAAGVERIVYTSSVATLGLHHDGSPADEKTPSTLQTMIGNYKRSKFMAEELVRKMIDEEGLPAVIVNPSTPIGPRDIKPTPTGRMIAEAVAGRMPAYMDTGLNIVHVDDVANGHLLALERGTIGQRYILGGENWMLEAILRAIAEQTDQAPPRWRILPGVILPLAYAVQAWTRLTGGQNPLLTVEGVRLARKRMFFSSAKARRELAYHARPALEAIGDAIAWFKEGREKNARVRAN